jgi:hypothetical protein
VRSQLAAERLGALDQPPADAESAKLEGVVPVVHEQHRRIPGSGVHVGGLGQPDEVVALDEPKRHGRRRNRFVVVEREIRARRTIEQIAKVVHGRCAGDGAGGALHLLSSRVEACRRRHLPEVPLISVGGIAAPQNTAWRREGWARWPLGRLCVEDIG